MTDFDAKRWSLLDELTSGTQNEIDGLEMFAWPNDLDGVVIHTSTSVHPRPLRWWQLWARYKRWRAARWAASWTVEYSDEPSERLSSE